MTWLKRLAGNVVGKFVLRAQLIPIGELTGVRWLWAKLTHTQEDIKRLNNLWPDFIAKNAELKKTNPDLYVDIKRQLLPTGDGSELDVVELCAPKNKDVKEYVIYGWGRSDSYEFFLPRLATDALNLNKKIITFNYRNVGHSKGTLNYEEDLVADYKFQIDRLIKQGVDPKNIHCYGHSLGGAAAAFAVNQKHKEKHPVKFYNDRSFANLMNTSINLFFKPKRRIRRSINTVGTLFFGSVIISALLLLGVITPLTALISAAATLVSLKVPPLYYLLDKTVGWILEKTLYHLMIYGKWVMDVAKAYEEIPADCKLHTVLRTARNTHSKHLGERKVDKAGFDKVILYPDSLHKNMPSHHEHTKALKVKLADAIQNGSEEHIAQSKGQLNKVLNVKMTGGEHTAWPHELFTRYKTHRSGRWITGQEHFYAFVEPEGTHDREKAPQYRKFPSPHCA